MQVSRTENGFTLVEVIVVMVILTVGVVGMVSAISGGIASSKLSSQLTAATMLIQQKLEEIEDQDVLEPGSDSGDFGEDYPRYTWEQEISYSEFDDGLYIVRVKVKWPDRGSERSKEVEALIWRGKNENHVEE